MHVPTSNKQAYKYVLILQIGLQIAFFMRTTCELETHIIAVERIAEYTSVPTEVSYSEEFLVAKSFVTSVCIVPLHRWQQVSNVFLYVFVPV